MKRELSFKAIPSGDGASFIFAVTKEEFIRIKGEKPTKCDKAPYDKGLYMVYPGDIFTFGILREPKLMSISVDVEEVE